MNDREQQAFYEELVRQLRSRGAVCAITSGLACVHYGVAETTKDCDLLCHPSSFDMLLELLGDTRIDDVQCRYRGNISPPLHERWHRGGWTSHFEWPVQGDPVTLDVFGHAIRESTPWPNELFGLYASPHTVAEMKRTNRDKDWSYLTALGIRMIEAGDDRGWLHLFDAKTLLELISQYRCPAVVAQQRPALQLALQRDRRIAGALNAERKLWEELDRRRIGLLERSLCPYVSAMRKARSGRTVPLKEDHEIRIRCATAHLPARPLTDYGMGRQIEESKKALLDQGVLPAEALSWLPDVEAYYAWLR